MRTPAKLREDYIKNSGNWLQWIKGVQEEAWNAALDRMQIEINSSSFSVEMKELLLQMTQTIKK